LEFLKGFYTIFYPVTGAVGVKKQAENSKILKGQLADFGCKGG